MLLNLRDLWEINCDLPQAAEAIHSFSVQQGFCLEKKTYEKDGGILVIKYVRPLESFWKELPKGPQLLEWRIVQLANKCRVELFFRLDKAFRLTLRLSYLAPWVILGLLWSYHAVPLMDSISEMKYSRAVALAYLVLSIFLVLWWFYVMNRALLRSGPLYQKFIEYWQAELDCHFPDQSKNLAFYGAQPDAPFLHISFALFILFYTLFLRSPNFFSDDLLWNCVMVLVVGAMLFAVPAIYVFFSRLHEMIQLNLMLSTFPSLVFAFYCWVPALLSIDSGTFEAVERLESASFLGALSLLAVQLLLLLGLLAVVSFIFWRSLPGRQDSYITEFLFREGRGRSVFRGELKNTGMFMYFCVISVWLLLSLATVTGLTLHVGAILHLFDIPLIGDTIIDLHAYWYSLAALVGGSFFSLWNMPGWESLSFGHGGLRLHRYEGMGDLLMFLYFLPILVLLGKSAIMRYRYLRQIRFAIKNSACADRLGKLIPKILEQLPVKLGTPRLVIDDTFPGSWTSFSLWRPFSRIRNVVFVQGSRLKEDAFSDKELIGLLAHEVCHLAYHHKLLWVTSRLSLCTLCGSNLLAILVNFWKMEEEADKFAAGCSGKDSMLSVLQKLYCQEEFPQTESNLQPEALFWIRESTRGISWKKEGGLWENVLFRWRLMVVHFAGLRLPMRYRHPDFEDRVCVIKSMDVA